MRPLLTASLLLAVTFSGCFGGGFDEESSTDVFGNSYAVLKAQGTPPESGETVEGATAQDLQLKADDLAAQWSNDSRLLWVSGVELAEGAVEGQEQFTGPEPEYDLFDASLGDGLAPAWNYLYMSPEKAEGSMCEFLFVHAAYNGFVVSYTFNPMQTSPPQERFDHWSCGDHAPVHSRAEWTVDSDTASQRIGDADDRFGGSAATAEAVAWGLAVHPDSDPEDDDTFDTLWVAGVFQDTRSTSNEDTLACTTPGSDVEGTTGCFAFGEEGGGSDDDPDGGEEEARLDPEQGSGTVSFGFVFSGAQTDAFTIENASHPLLTVEYSVDANQVSSSYTIELLDINGTAVDSVTETPDGSTITGSLEASDPVTGEWSVQVSGDSGSPEVDYTWCAQGYDVVTETVIECPTE